MSKHTQYKYTVGAVGYIGQTTTLDVTMPPDTDWRRVKQLLIAAPELLEALEFYGHLDRTLDEIADDGGEIARAAIAKAKEA